jgi:hypothetical protein
MTSYQKEKKKKKGEKKRRKKKSRNTIDFLVGRKQVTCQIQGIIF